MAKEYIEREALLEDLQAAKEHGGMGSIVADTLARYVKRAPAADVVEVIERTEEIESAINCLNFYRNCHYNESSNTEEYEIANAINIILPLFCKCLGRS